jgi:hypothetical protein
MTDTLTHCSFCDKHKDQIGKLIVSQDVAICNECIEFCNKLLKDTKKSKLKTDKKAIPDPRDIRDYLDQFVVGQDEAKIVLAVAIANHYKRISNEDRDTEIAKGNILMIGPTGTGKTLMARTVAEYLDVPFVIGEPLRVVGAAAGLEAGQVACGHAVFAGDGRSAGGPSSWLSLSVAPGSHHCGGGAAESGWPRQSDRPYLPLGSAPPAGSGST